MSYLNEKLPWVLLKSARELQIRKYLMIKKNFCQMRINGLIDCGIKKFF